MAAINRDQFTDAITRAVYDRGRVYNNSFALSIYWERDNTNATEDVGHFQAILSTLNFDPAEVEIISEGDKTPGWTLMDTVRSIFQRAADAPGKSIVFIHYAGHGEVKKGELFAVGGPTRRSLNFNKIIDEAVAAEWAFDVANTDTVFVLDCCYAHAATRAPSTTTRVVEIISATDDITPKALAPPRNTLTGKLRTEIARRKRDGHQFMELSDVMATIRADSPVVKPTHHVKLGSSVRLLFTGVTRIDPNTIAPSLRAVFSVHIAENMTQDQLNRLIQWINDLPSSYAMELDGVYQTNSTLLIFQGAYALFTNLAGYPGINFISEVSSPNLRQYFGQEQQQQAPPSVLKENVPFSRPSKE